MTHQPFISVIVPAHDAASQLAVTLPAIRAGSDSARATELIVVDDGSTDRTADIATPFADRVVRLASPASGPARARNAGAAAATGDWLLFVDADVKVHAGTLDQVSGAIASHAGAVAIFGSYDGEPSERGTVTQFRNLLHHYVHSRSPGPADTFWAGLGAVRRDAFLAAGGFDADRFPRPQIEDIELGYRLRDRGGLIVLDPAIQGTHLKRWTILSMVTTDFRDRGVPWMRLLLERWGRSRGTLAAGGAESIRVALAGLGGLALVLWLPLAPSGIPIAVVAAASWGTLAVANLPMHLWFARRRGPLFAAASVPLLAIYYLVSAAAAVAGVLAFVGGRLRTGALPRARAPN